MKREIIFRVYIKLNKQGKEYYSKEEALFIESKIHEVVSICLKYNNLTILEQDEKSVLTIFKDYCDVYELMKFTGLTDKNGVEIFEGDILKSNMYNKKWIVDFTPCDGLKLAIKYEDDFKINGIFQTHEDWSYNKISSCEIIGNIHEQ